MVKAGKARASTSGSIPHNSASTPRPARKEPQLRIIAQRSIQEGCRRDGAGYEV